MEHLQEIGQIRVVQLQPSGLIIEKESGWYYDVSRLMAVDRLQMTPAGIEAITQDGVRVLDIHHLSHPDKAYDDDDLVCIGFTSHYKAMRARFGEHMVDGIGGENIIIDSDLEVRLQDLGKGVAIENQDTGSRTLLDLVSIASPCHEFSQFAMQQQDQKPAASELKSVLQFLGDGRRGFLLVMREGQPAAEVRPGDLVFTFS